VKNMCIQTFFFTCLTILVCFASFSCSEKSSKQEQENVQPVCWVYPTFLDFDTVTAGEHSDTVFFVVNMGGGTLHGNISESCDNFSILNGGGAYSLTTDQIRSVTLRFEPDSAGSVGCHIETGNDLCENVACIGFCKPAPACSVDPSNIDFGVVPLGLSVDTSFTITNIGEVILEGWVSMSSAGDCRYNFFFISGQGSYSLAPGESRTVKIRFDPYLGVVTCNIITGNSACGSVYCIGSGGLGGRKQ